MDVQLSSVGTVKFIRRDYIRKSVESYKFTKLNLLRGDVEGVVELLEAGVDVNSIDLDGRTAFHIAARECHNYVVELLLSRKAHIDACDRWGLSVWIATKFLKPDKKTADLVGNEEMKASESVRHIVIPCSSSARA
ncbi:hypothetical protein AgCh_017372 [Apium graveolens]